MDIPNDYLERVYAGVLGKIIGVYLGRPIEGWSYERITRELGEISYYVHEKLGLPLIVTDDDISGTFTFLRALPDYGNSRDLTPAQIGQTWLNYIIEGRTILWWGGLGNSTEHTAYLRLKSGIPAPRSGSQALNGKLVAEQIGAQIFIDGWALVAPGDPELAADLARRAASVSHAGEAVYAAQVLAAMEALAFLEPDIQQLLDCGTSLIPRDAVIYRLIADVRDWHAGERDWRVARERLTAGYGYDKYGGNCHVVPNHGLIILSLLYGENDFQRSLMIVNTAGWDTDCNSGNVGCLLGIKNGLTGLEAGPDWRGPVADRLYLPTADGGRAITDAVCETYRVVNVGRALAGKAPLTPKGGARFHFELPGSLQGFQVEDSVASAGTAAVENVEGHSRYGARSLAIRYHHLAPGRMARVATATFTPPEAIDVPGYSLVACPTLYPGQGVKAVVAADPGNETPVTCRLYTRSYGTDDRLARKYGPEAMLEPGMEHRLEWRIGDSGGAPIAEIGLEIGAARRADGSVYLDYLTWEGTPDALLTRPAHGGQMWQRAWVDGVDQFRSRPDEPYRLVQNHGSGLLIQGTREWSDYRISATVTPHLVRACGIGARVQGMRRYYGLLLYREGVARLVKTLDGDHALAEVDFPWEMEESYLLSLQVAGQRLEGSVDGRLLFSMEDIDRPLTGGGVALICTEGCMSCGAVRVEPA